MDVLKSAPDRSKNPVIELYHSRLFRTISSRYKRECPFCYGGLFLVGRDRETFDLQEYDNCILCGQQVRYLDIDKMREKEKRK